MIVSHNLLGPPPIPDTVQTALAAVVTAACGALVAGLSGYYTRPQAHTRVIYDERQRPSDRPARRLITPSPSHRSPRALGPILA
jgi:hypothetical protein